MIKVVSGKPSGTIRYTTAKKQSSLSRTKQLLRELGISQEDFKRQSSLRLYSRMVNHPVLGYQSF